MKALWKKLLPSDREISAAMIHALIDEQDHVWREDAAYQILDELQHGPEMDANLYDVCVRAAKSHIAPPTWRRYEAKKPSGEIRGWANRVAYAILVEFRERYTESDVSELTTKLRDAVAERIGTDRANTWLDEQFELYKVQRPRQLLRQMAEHAMPRRPERVQRYRLRPEKVAKKRQADQTVTGWEPTSAEIAARVKQLIDSNPKVFGGADDALESVARQQLQSEYRTVKTASAA